MQFENQAMGFFYAGRLAAHGYQVETEVIGTRGSLRVGSVPHRDHVEILGSEGVVRTCSRSFPERFGEAFVAELTHFVDAVLEDRQPEITLADGTAATAMAALATWAFRTGEMVTAGGDPA
jgi:myo-inositol 2-dehydrogenase/D-chiro-inositol 1-dehydrogenase